MPLKLCSDLSGDSGLRVLVYRVNPQIVNRVFRSGGSQQGGDFGSAVSSDHYRSNVGGEVRRRG